jgi:uncharacterized protein (DUF2336 family)
MLRHLTDLYLVGGESYSEDEIAVIDDVFVRLVSTIEESSRALLAIRLAPLAKAPPRILRLLACDNAIEVSAPVLTHSAQVDADTLVECARTRSQDHLLAISRRQAIPEAVTDVLVERGGPPVLMSTAANAGARFSDQGFARLVVRARGDDELVERIGQRPDLPPRLFKQLLEAASEVVRTRLEAEKTHARSDIGRTVARVAARIESEALTRRPEYALAEVLVQSLSQAGLLNGAKLEEFVAAGRYEEIVAALALMAGMPGEVVERSVNDTRAESLLVLARAIGLSWQTTRSILALAGERHRRTAADIGRCTASFQRLNPVTARRILEFQRTRGLSAARRH